ncbi:MAG: serA [Chlorobi bacterium]|nr:serA [Chlorobiota bacterium]
MSEFKVLIADAVSRDCDRILTERGIEVTRAVGVSKEELYAMLPEYDGMIVRSAVQVDRAMIGTMTRMRAIGRAGAGVDNIDVVAATEKGVVVMNTPGGNTISATEHTVAMLLSLLRKIPSANASLRSGAWDRKSFTGTELMGKRVGILGLGRIGREVARRLQSFDTVVTGFDPVLSSDAVRDLGIEPATFDEMMAASDIITIHVPLLPETRGMIGEKEMARMRDGIFLVNCARGGIIDEAALLAALESGKVAGAAIDVFEPEPPQLPNPLISHPRVVATPHIAASTEEAQQRVALDIAVQIADLFEGKGARGVVNAAGLESSLGSEALPMMGAAERLGSFLGQLVGNGDVACRLTVYGPEATPIVRGLGAAFLAGMIGVGREEKANAINAELLAEKSGVTLTTVGERVHHHFNTLICAEVSHGGESRSAAITVFGRNEPRLVMIDGIWLDIRPAGSMVLFQNLDRPGVLAAVGAVLADRGVNIADVALGRREGTGHALTIMRTDGPIDEATLADLQRLEVIEKIRTLSFPEE